MISQKKTKAFANFAFKGVVGAVVAIYIVLFGLSFWNIHQYNQRLSNYETIKSQHEVKTEEKKKIEKELAIITKSIQLTRTLKSNKEISYRVLAQVAMSVPKRVRFSKLEFNGKNIITIEGDAFSDQDILKLIENLNKQKLIKQASLTSMTLPASKSEGAPTMKGFRITCKMGKNKS